MTIAAHKVKRDVPIGSEVEITIEINKSRLVLTKAYIPVLDGGIGCQAQYLRKERPEPKKLQQQLTDEKKRLEDARTKAKTAGDARADGVLQRINSERMVPELESLLAAAETDPDTADKCQNRLLEFQIALDEIESSLEWPALVADVDKWIKWGEEEIAHERNASDKERGLLGTDPRSQRHQAPARR